MATRLLRPSALGLTQGPQGLQGLARGAGGGPIDYRESHADGPLKEEDELWWTDASKVGEPALDNWAPTLTDGQALAYWTGGLAFLYGVYQLAVFRDKASRVPWAPREFPYDDLKAEMGTRHHTDGRLIEGATTRKL